MSSNQERAEKILGRMWMLLTGPDWRSEHQADDHAICAV